MSSTQSTMITWRTSDAIRDALKKIAKRRGCSMNALITRIVLSDSHVLSLVDDEEAALARAAGNASGAAAGDTDELTAGGASSLPEAESEEREDEWGADGAEPENDSDWR